MPYPTGPAATFVAKERIPTRAERSVRRMLLVNELVCCEKVSLACLLLYEWPYVLQIEALVSTLELFACCCSGLKGLAIDEGKEAKESGEVGFLMCAVCRGDQDE